MAIIFRTAYNNQDWKGACRQPSRDPHCFQCFTDTLNIDPPNHSDDICSGKCWERDICVKYRWGCTPHGTLFGMRAYPGAKAYFVYKQIDGNYALWGVTEVKDIDRGSVKGGDPALEDGWSFIHLEPFQPLPQDRRVRNLTVKDLIGIKNWRTGRHRYIDATREEALERLITGESQLSPESKGSPTPEGARPISQEGKWATVTIKIPPHINDRLEEIAQKEGRAKEDLVREAIAEWLRDREKIAL